MDDWLWIAPTRLGSVAAPVLLGLLVVFSLAALWPRRVPGEMSDAERRAPGRWVRTVVVLAAPWLVVLGALLILYPVLPPRHLLLSSRARTSGAELQWRTTWEERFGSREGIDLGATVDAICDRLLDLDSVWNLDDPTTQKHIRSLVLDVVQQQMNVTGPVTHRAEERLSGRLVESVELAVLKYQTHSSNVSSASGLFLERPTTLGMAHDDLERYLDAGSPRTRPTRWNFARQAGLTGPRLELILPQTRAAKSGWLVLALVALPADPAERPVRMRLRARTKVGPIGAVREVDLQPERWPRLQRIEVPFPDVPADAELVAVEQVNPSVLRRLPPRPGAGGLGIELAVTDARRWRESWERLQSAPAFASWRVRMDELGLPRGRVKWDDSQGAIVIESMAEPPIVRVRRRGEAIPPTAKMVPEPRAGLGQAEPGLSAVYSWDRLPLPDPQVALGATGAVSASRVTLGPTLLDGNTRLAGTRPTPLETRLDLALPGGGFQCVTELAIDLTSVLEATADTTRQAVFWTAILEAIARAESARGSAQVHVADGPPVFLLRDSDLAEVHPEMLNWHLLPFAAGLLGFTLLVIQGILSLPRHHTRQS